MEEAFNLGEQLLVVFDGRCGFCNGVVRWLVRRDRGDRLRFAASELEKVAGLLARHGFDAAAGPPGTILVARGAGGTAERVLIKSDAAVAVLRELPGLWAGVGVVLGWIPRAVRDAGYGLVARWRYRLWGRLESCPLPTEDERGRFL